MKTLLKVLVALALVGAWGCDGDESGTDAGPVADGGPLADGGPPPVDGGGELVVPTTYEFESRFNPGTSSVEHVGQTNRQVLIQELNAYVGRLTAGIDGASGNPDFTWAADGIEEGELIERLDYYFRVDGAERVDDPIRYLTTDPPSLQENFGDITNRGSLLEKVAGNNSTDHQDWTTEFRGFSDDAIAAHGGGITSPALLVEAIFETLEANAIARAEGTSRLSPSGEELPVHVTESGIDLQQLLEKFLLGAIAFQQGADGYLDDDLEGTGLLTDNVDDVGPGYTRLEHHWDEAWGYFGAAIDYGLWADEISGRNRYRDIDGDGRIDFGREYSFGASVNAATRDRASAEGARTQMAMQAWDAFRTGRAIITHAGGALDEETFAALLEQRNLAEQAWEAGIAATALHYANDTLQDMSRFGTEEYSFLDHAKHWGELKGFALYFQFSPRSPMTRAQFEMLHGLIGDAPVLATADAAEIDAYRVSLRQVRTLLAEVYGFGEANIGDDDGFGGW